MFFIIVILETIVERSIFDCCETNVPHRIRLVIHKEMDNKLSKNYRYLNI